MSSRTSSHPRLARPLYTTNTLRRMRCACVASGLCLACGNGSFDVLARPWQRLHIAIMRRGRSPTARTCVSMVAWSVRPTVTTAVLISLQFRLQLASCAFWKVVSHHLFLRGLLVGLLLRSASGPPQHPLIVGLP